LELNTLRSEAVSIKFLMGMIAILGLNSALLRAALSHNVLPKAGIFGPMTLVVQLGILALVQRPPGHRSFWLGFTSAGIGTLIGIAWIIITENDFFGELWFK
jgi:hypothetical protein